VTRLRTRRRPTAAALDACAAAIVDATDAVFDELSTMGATLERAWSAAIDTVGCYETADLADLQHAVFDTLDRNPALESAGYVLAEGTLSDRNRHLDWWHRNGTGDYEFLLLNLDVDAPDCYDYYSMEWFRAAVDHGRRFVSGPLIDLPCADVYIMTFSTPIVAGHRGTRRLLGIAGADVAVSRFEPQIMPALRELPIEAVLVNRERRVIASNDAAYTTGEKLPSLPGDDSSWHDVVPVTDDLGWVLAAGAARVR
jgi:hypothetical protein